MNKDVEKYFNEAVEEGIITNKQRLDLKLKLGRDKIDNGKRMSRLADLVLSLIFVLLIMSSIILIINYTAVNYIIGVSISIMFLSFSIFTACIAIKKNNYFLKELATCMNVFSNVMLVTSFNKILKYDYYYPDNILIGIIMSLPLAFTINAYILRFLIVIGFCVFTVPYFNFSFLPVYNPTIIGVITILMIIAVLYKLAIFLLKEQNDKSNVDDDRYLSSTLRISMQEIMLYLLLMKINRLFISDENIILVYVVYIILLIRRSSIFTQAVEIPIIFDNLFFIYTAFFFARYDGVQVLHESGILLLHAIAYLVYFTLLKNNKLNDVDKWYRIQGQFYINIFLLTYVLFYIRHENTDFYMFIIGVAVGIFNVYAGRESMKLEFVVIGLIIVIVSVLFAGALIYSPITILLSLICLGFMLYKLWYKVKDEVIRNNEE